MSADEINIADMNIKSWIIAGALAVLVVGGVVAGATIRDTQAQADAQTKQVLVVKAETLAAAEQSAADDAAAQAVIDATTSQQVADAAAAAALVVADALAAQNAAEPVTPPARAVTPTRTAAPVAPAPGPLSTPLAPSAPEPVAAAPTAPVNPLVEWLKNPTFTCAPGFAPGWMDETGKPTSCVAN